MGLIKAGMGAVGGTLADQWKEFFYCESMLQSTEIVQNGFGERMKRLQNLTDRLIKIKEGGFSWQTCKNINVLAVAVR